MKKLLVLMMALAMTLSLAACGGDEPAPSSAGFTAEQQALAQNFMSMAEEFDAIADKVNASPELLSDEELVTAMNELADEIIKADEYFANPETLTPEVMGALTVAIDVGRTFIAEASAALDEIEDAKAASLETSIVVPVEIFNGTGVDIHALALSPANDNNWGENLITEVIKNGEKVQAELVFTADTLVWDILVQDGSENQLTFMGVDFTNANADGAKLFLEATEGGDYFASVN
ncbi:MULTISPECIES: lipoprotein [unclassified Lacrimispora]|uniref:LptM family lipoprotein n=1 Tax=unclassified Lacrimispora TaxID=2719232 RepID=UPI0037704605